MVLFYDVGEKNVYKENDQKKRFAGQFLLKSLFFQLPTFVVDSWQPWKFFENSIIQGESHTC